MLRSNGWRIPRCFALSMLVLNATNTSAWDEIPNFIPSSAWFRQDVCMSPEKLALALELGYIRTERNSCCNVDIKFHPFVFRNPTRLLPIAAYLVDKPPSGTCAELIANTENEAILLARADAAAADLIARTSAKLVADERAGLPSKLKDMSLAGLCADAGRIARKETNLFASSLLPESENISAIQREMSSRRQRINIERTRREDLYLGDSACQAYASWGLPDSINRTMTVGRTALQNVYKGNRYVYVVNGVVTGIQD